MGWRLGRTSLTVDQVNVDDGYKAPVIRMLPGPPDRHQSLANLSCPLIFTWPSDGANVSGLKLYGTVKYCKFGVVKISLSLYLNISPKLILLGWRQPQFQICDPAASEADQPVGIQNFMHRTQNLITHALKS